MKNLFLLAIGIIFIGGSFYLFLENPAPLKEVPQNEEIPEGNEALTEIQIGEATILVELADTPAERQQGLSGRESLEQGHGMLFVFDNTKPHGIWMKDMLIPIDIVWMDEEKQIIWIESEVSPDTYPNIFYPKSASKYVLELPAGFVEENLIDTGSIVSW